MSHPVRILFDNFLPSGWPSRSPGSVENITGETAQHLTAHVSQGGRACVRISQPQATLLDPRFDMRSFKTAQSLC